MRYGTTIKILFGLVVFFSWWVLFVNDSVPYSRAQEPLASKPQSSIEIVLKLLADMFGGSSTSSGVEKDERCRQVAELDKLIAQHPEVDAPAIDASFREGCDGYEYIPTDNSHELDIDFSTPIPSGRCENIADPAIRKVIHNSFLMDTYRAASVDTGVPWEVLAAIHYVEAGNNPGGSLISGRPIGVREPDDNDHVYHSLIETAVASAREFKQKQSIALKTSQGKPYDFETLVGAFALYNGPGNSQCDGSAPKSLASGYRGCPAEFKYEDHIYPLACFDEKHARMNVIYCGDGRPCSVQTPYQKIGGLTFIKALQKELGTLSFDPIDHTRDSSSTIKDGFVYYPQCNGSQHRASWANQSMTNSRGNSIGCTYCKASCGLAASAMIVSSYTDQSINPVTFLSTYNTTQNMTCDGALLPTLGTTLKKYDITVGNHIAFNQASLSNDLFIQKAKSFLQNGWTLLTLGYFNGFGHYVWIVGIDAQDHFLIYDPYWGVNSHLPFNSANYRSARITYITPVKK